MRATRSETPFCPLPQGEGPGVRRRSWDRLSSLSSFSLLLAVTVALPIGAAQAATAVEHLRMAPAPEFRAGHPLPALTRWGWRLPFEVQVELAQRWGYALEFSHATAASVARLDDPESVEARVVRLAATDPERYRLCILSDHNWARGKEELLPPDTWCRDEAGELVDGKRIWSPEAPDETFVMHGRAQLEPILRIRERAPISIILNGGEYALGVYGFSGEAWQKDPRVRAARGDRPWLDYISERKAHQEGIIADIIREGVPDLDLYLFYHTEGKHRNRYGHWWHWAWHLSDMLRTSDLPSSSCYYAHYNSGWTGDNDLLTQTTNAVAQSIAVGAPLSYNWVCAGWGDRETSRPDLYMGYLKAYYTAGMIGGIAGYFEHSTLAPGLRGDDLGPTPPSWLWQMMVLAHVHGLFSHLDAYLSEGDLLPGPLAHRWSQDLPAFELPTGEENVRVLVRRHRELPQWLITAWAADGLARDVVVEVPDLGMVTVHARPEASVYVAGVADGVPQLVMQDPESSLLAHLGGGGR